MIRELAIALVLVMSTDVTAADIAETQKRIVGTLEAKAKKIKVIKKLSDLTNLSIGKVVARIRPDKITVTGSDDKSNFKFTTNLKDEVNFKYTINF